MTQNGVFLADEDGSIYFLPDEVLQACRLDGEALDRLKVALDETDEPDVAGFISTSRSPFGGGLIGEAIGAAVGGLAGGPECDARDLQKQAGMADISASRSPLSLSSMDLTGLRAALG